MASPTRTATATPTRRGTRYPTRPVPSRMITTSEMDERNTPANAAVAPDDGVRPRSGSARATRGETLGDASRARAEQRTQERAPDDRRHEQTRGKGEVARERHRRERRGERDDERRNRKGRSRRRRGGVRGGVVEAFPSPIPSSAAKSSSVPSMDKTVEMTSSRRPRRNAATSLCCPTGHVILGAAAASMDVVGTHPTKRPRRHHGDRRARPSDERPSPRFARGS